MSDGKVYTINTDTVPQEAELVYLHQEEHGWPIQRVSRVMTSDQLIHVIDRHRGYQHWPNLLQLIATHAAARGVVHDYIVSSTDDPVILSTIATSGMASRATLGILQVSKSRSVREHAEFALLGLLLDEANAADFERLLTEHAGSDLHDAAVRAFLAAHKNAPMSVLLALSRDSVNFVRQTALGRLAKGGA